MPYVVRTSRDTLTRGQDHPGSEKIAACGETAVRAP
jgi:hypothetical protein